MFRDIHVGAHESWLDPLFWLISSTGLGWVQITLIVLSFPWRRAVEAAPEDGFWAGLAALLRNDPPINVTLAVAWLITGIIDTLVKHAVPRERPSNLIWSHPQENIFANSFASGHTATSFGIAWTVFFITRGTPHARWGWLALLWAALVGFSRMYRGVHWPSDVISGFFVGLGCACLTMVVVPERFYKAPLPSAQDC